MSRVVKDAEVRRKELLDTALSLFEREGYERTSIDRITEEVGIAKGTFYHYFASKQDLLEQLVTDWADDLFERLERALAEMDADGLARLRAVFVLGGQWKLEERDTSMAFAQSLYSADNIRLRHALWGHWLEFTARLLTPIIAQGAEEGTFDVADAEATSSILAGLWFGWSDGQAERMLDLAEHPERADGVVRDLAAMETAMERILGMTQGTLKLGLGTYIEQFTEER